MHETIGEGALSRVRRGVHKISGITRAVKVVRKEDLEFGERRKLLEEIELLKQLDHPNIGQVVEMFEDKKKIYFVNEMMHGGTLYQRVLMDSQFNEVKSANIIKQLISAVNYLHQNNIVHGDIKPQNIHYKDAKSDAIVKLIDFGTSRRVNQEHAMHGVFGTVYYLAPEVIEGTYSEKCDVWAVGVILYILLCGEPPFNGETDAEIVENIKGGEYTLSGPAWEGISQEAKDLLTRMLCPENERISAAEAFQHPWFGFCRQIEEDNDDAELHQRNQNVARALANLKSFSSKNVVKQAALGYLIQHFMTMNDAMELQ